MGMKSFLRIICSLMVFSATGNLVYAQDFGNSNIAPLFPLVNGEFQLPASPATSQLAWLLSELAADEFTTLAEVQANFDGSFDAAAMQDTINNTLRPAYPNAVVTDVIGVTPVEVTVLFNRPNPVGNPLFTVLRAEFTGSQRITAFGTGEFGTAQFPDDQNLTLNQAIDEFQTVGTENSVFVGFIDNNGQCVEISERNSSIPRATGSIFKTWVLGGVADDVAAGRLDRSDSVPLIASERALGGAINTVPLGTVFTVQQMSTLMMAISDNTATDHMHQIVGRELIGDIIQQYGVADPDILLPLLSVSEQFHLLFSFSLPQAQSYVLGSETFQQQFLNNQIIPLGPTFPLNAPFFNTRLLTEGTWRASPLDICNTLAGLRSTSGNNGAFELVNEAMGSQAAQPSIRNVWDRVWFKGGSLESGVSGLHVLTHAWLLENSGEFPRVVITMANNPAGNIDEFIVQSLTSRIVETVADVVIPEPPESDFDINVGIAGSWFNPDTNGQGWVFDVVDNPGTQLLASAWFTFDTGLPGANDNNGFGSTQQRWFSASGNFTGNTAVLQVFSPSGGVFNDPDFTVNRGPAVGTMTVSFSGCSNGQIAFDFNDPAIADDTVSIRRITSSTLCQAIADGQSTLISRTEDLPVTDTGFSDNDVNNISSVNLVDTMAIRRPLEGSGQVNVIGDGYFGLPVSLAADDGIFLAEAGLLSAGPAGESVTLESDFEINVGIAGSWFNPDTNGQGWVFDVVNNANTQLLASAWFTFDTGLPGANDNNGFGSTQQRWFSASGNFTGDTAVLQVFSPTGGVFNNPNFVVDRGEAVGTMTVSFSDCSNGQIAFDFDDPMVADDTVAIRRITSSTLCQAIADGSLATN